MTTDEFVANKYICLWLMIKLMLFGCINEDMKNLLEKMCFSKISNVLTFHLLPIPHMSLPHEHYRQVNMVWLYLHSRWILKAYKDGLHDEDRKLGLWSLFSSSVNHLWWISSHKYQHFHHCPCFRRKNSRRLWNPAQLREMLQNEYQFHQGV